MTGTSTVTSSCTVERYKLVISLFLARVFTLSVLSRLYLDRQYLDHVRQYRWYWYLDHFQDWFLVLEEDLHWTL
jgi:hypothetical protein